MRKPAFCICENKDADQLRGNREADQRLCFRYTDSTIPLLSKYEISSFYPSYAVVQPGLCWTWSKTPKTGFLTTRLICGRHYTGGYNKPLVSDALSRLIISQLWIRASLWAYYMLDKPSSSCWWSFVFLEDLQFSSHLIIGLSPNE